MTGASGLSLAASIHDDDVSAGKKTGGIIIQQSGGKSFAAETSDQLGSIYDALTHDIAYETKTQEVTALFVGIALALAVAAAIAALLWTQRIV